MASAPVAVRLFGSRGAAARVRGARGELLAALGSREGRAVLGAWGVEPGAVEELAELMREVEDEYRDPEGLFSDGSDGSESD